MIVKEFHVAGFRFFSDCDSGNLGRVELVEGADEAEVTSEPRPSTSTLQHRSAGTETPDAKFRLWTRPDCQDTEFENGNRTWFLFGLEGGEPGAVVTFTMMNLNKQSKLFSQGMTPVFLPPGRTQWERIRDPPTYETIDSNFQMSFKFRNPAILTGPTYFAFTYPYTYKELQTNLDRLHRRQGNGCKPFSELKALPDTTIYFHRETAIRSLEKRKLSLLTITGLNGIQEEKEQHLENLFEEEKDNRPHLFKGKKVVFVSARVHPGETCSSHVMNGFIKFLLRENDARAAVLRKKYVFKLIPMLNPDGVVNGHYRTDTRGVNLNRVYSNPSVSLNPTIYAARKLILYAHLGNQYQDHPTPSHECLKDAVPSTQEHMASDTESVKDADFAWEVPTLRNKSHRSSSSSRNSASLPSFPTLSPFKSDYGSQWYEMTENSRCSEGDESIADFSLNSVSKNMEESARFDCLMPESLSAKVDSRTNFLGALSPVPTKPEELDTVKEFSKPSTTTGSEDNPIGATNLEGAPTFPPENGESELFMYIDIHGHASKRGIFIYGNHFDNTETKVDALLFPKLMSMNSANFDFPACNFSQRNMFMKDRHTGAGREGSGRVSVYRATGITYCYTLECNFNTGRFTNSIPAASRDLGRATPPPVYDIPPKYNPAHYEETGKSLAISILDLTESNPWTRLTCSPSKNLKGVRTWIRNYLKNSEIEAANKAKSVKGSPIRTRLRNLVGVKKTAVKQLNLNIKSPKSPDAPRSLSKMPRKMITTKNSQQSTSAKLSRQLSSSSTNTISEPRTGEASSSARPRSRSSATKLKATKRPGSKTGARTKVVSKSRSGSPRRSLTEPRANKPGGQKLLTKRSSSKFQEVASSLVPGTPRIKKLKKKKIVSN